MVEIQTHIDFDLFTPLDLVNNTFVDQRETISKTLFKITIENGESSYKQTFTYNSPFGDIDFDICVKPHHDIQISSPVNTDTDITTTPLSLQASGEFGAYLYLEAGEEDRALPIEGSLAEDSQLLDLGLNVDQFLALAADKPLGVEVEEVVAPQPFKKATGCPLPIYLPSVAEERSPPPAYETRGSRIIGDEDLDIGELLDTIIPLSPSLPSLPSMAEQEDIEGGASPSVPTCPDTLADTDDNSDPPIQKEPTNGARGDDSDDDEEMGTDEVDRLANDIDASLSDQETLLPSTPEEEVPTNHDEMDLEEDTANNDEDAQFIRRVRELSVADEPALSPSPSARNIRSVRRIAASRCATPDSDRATSTPPSPCTPSAASQDSAVEQRSTRKRRSDDDDDGNAAPDKAKKNRSDVKMPDLIEAIHKSVLLREHRSLSTITDLPHELPATYSSHELHKSVWVDQQRAEGAAASSRVSLLLIALYWSIVTGAARHPESRPIDIGGVLNAIGDTVDNNRKIRRFIRAGCVVKKLIDKMGFDILLCPAIRVRGLRDTTNIAIDELTQYLDRSPEFCARMQAQLQPAAGISESRSTVIDLASNVISTAEAILSVTKPIIL